MSAYADGKIAGEGGQSSFENPFKKNVDTKHDLLHFEWLRGHYKGNGKCLGCEEGLYPFVGMAPHFHCQLIGGGEENVVFFPEEKWPDNFLADPELYGMGIWYCPDCELKIES